MTARQAPTNFLFALAVCATAAIGCDSGADSAAVDADRHAVSQRPVDVVCRIQLNNPFDNKNKTASALEEFAVGKAETHRVDSDDLDGLQEAQLLLAGNTKSSNSALKKAQDGEFTFKTLRKKSKKSKKTIDYDYVTYVAKDGTTTGRVFFKGSLRAVARVMKDRKPGKTKVLGCFPRKPCDVGSVASATSCMTTLDIDDGEEENSIGVVTIRAGKESLARVVKGDGIAPGSITGKAIQKALKSADFLAVVNQHFDEDELTYYAINRSKVAKPTPLFSVNVVDIDPYPLFVQPLDWALTNPDIDGWHYDDFEERFEEAKAEAGEDFDLDQFKADLREAAADAIFISEGDSSRQRISANSQRGSRTVTVELVRAAFGQTIDAAFVSEQSDVRVATAGFDLSSTEETEEFLADLATAFDDDDFTVENAAAFAKVKALVDANLTDVQSVKIGPANPDGSLDEDAGLYVIVVVGFAPSGDLAGFLVTSVET